MDENSNVILCAYRPHQLDSITAVEKVKPSVVHKLDNEVAVYVEDAHHSYSRTDPVLRGLDMSVPTSTIYGLLGASGCGKTTLLKCIIGSLAPDSGRIEVFGLTPKDAQSAAVGYMPQEVALYQDLSVEEILKYFGRLCLMTWSQVDKQIDHLVAILDLPSKKRVISTLSAGQMRRVSFAAAIIHEPSLVILDEPTVGVDPILRANIWKHLKNMSENRNMTIILTTHYIEEARHSDMVGFMRKGRLLAEEPPRVMMNRYNAKTLEAVFLELCTSKNVVQPIRRPERPEVKPEARPVSAKSQSAHKLLVTSNQGSNWGQKHTPLEKWFLMFITLVWKNFIRNLRHPQALVAQFVLPLLPIILFGICIGADPFDISVGIVNEDNPPNLSLLFLKHLDPYVIQQKHYSSLEEAIQEAKRTQLWGVLHFKANFSEALMDRIDTRNDISNETIAESQIKLYADFTDKVILLTTQRSLDETYVRFYEALHRELDLNPNLATLPIVLGYPIYGTSRHEQRKGFRDYMAPGIVICATFGVSFGLTLILFILEKQEKTFDRNIVSGLTLSQIVVANIMVRLVFVLIQVIIALSVTIYIFDVPSRGPIVCALLIILSQNMCGIASAILMSSFCRTLPSAIMVVIGVLLFTMFVNGVLWPIQAIPKWMQWFSLVQPLTIPMNSLRSILFRGWGFTDAGTLMGFGVTTGWAVFLFTIGMKLFKAE